MSTSPSSGVSAWLIGRVSPTNSEHITTILFGLFSDDPLPPKKFWFFVGKNLESTQNLAFEADEIACNRRLHPYSEEQLIPCRKDPIEIEYLSKFTTKSKSAFILRGCALWTLNGRYIERGSAGGAFQFYNVRGWKVFKRYLNQVPELGISVDTCYNPNENKTVSDLFDARSDAAYAALVSREPRRPGDPSDRSLFAELVSAGLRSIVRDQTSQNLRNADLLASIRTKASTEALALLLLLRAEDEDATATTPKEALHVGVSVEAEEVRLIRSSDDMTLIGSELQNGMDCILARNIEYQSSSLGLVSSSSAHTVLEAELSSDLLRAIEKREIALTHVKLESARVQRRAIDSAAALYSPALSVPSIETSQLTEAKQCILSPRGDRDKSNDSQTFMRRPRQVLELEELLSLLNTLREVSVTVLEAFAAWLRFCKAGQRNKISAQANKLTFSVFLATKVYILPIFT
jgi:hypothetical protein